MAREFNLKELPGWLRGIVTGIAMLVGYWLGGMLNMGAVMQMLVGGLLGAGVYKFALDKRPGIGLDDVGNIMLGSLFLALLPFLAQVPQLAFLQPVAQSIGGIFKAAEEAAQATAAAQTAAGFDLATFLASAFAFMGSGNLGLVIVGLIKDPQKTVKEIFE